MSYEDNAIHFARTAKQLDVIIGLLTDFEATHRVKPERILLARSCKLAFVVELMERTGLDSSEIILEPFILAGVPIITSTQLGEHYVVLTNSKLKATITL